MAFKSGAADPEPGTTLNRLAWLALALLGVLLGNAFLGSWWLFLLVCVPLTGAILAIQGALRFRRTRRFFRNLGVGLLQLARFRRPSGRVLRVVGISVAVIVLLVIVNALHLSLPGKGRGLSVPTDGVGFAAAFSSAGAVLISIPLYAVVAVILVLTWLRMWRPFRARDVGWERIAYWTCLGLFVVAPILFVVAVNFLAPKGDTEAGIKANIRFTELWITVTIIVMSLAFCFAIGLPHVQARGRPAAPEPVAAAPAPPR